MIAEQRENGELELFSECEPVIASSKRMRDEKGSWKTVITAEKVNGTISVDLGEENSEKFQIGLGIILLLRKHPT